jgi:hypothetical protein
VSLRRTVLASLTCGAVLLPAAAAAAAEPEKSGWWNRLSAGGLVVPQPTAQPGDLRVASGADAPSAYAAVLYRTPEATGATLDLTVRSTVGTPKVVACPTREVDWPGGENQPFAAAPEFDCDAAMAVASLSEDGRTLSFVLDESSQIEPGVWSLALVPQPGSGNGVFRVDVEQPAPEAFVVTSSSELAFFTPSEPSTTESGTSGSGSSTSGEPFLPGGFDEPFLPGGFDEPFLPGGFDALAGPPTSGTAETPLVATGPEPAVAGSAPPTTGRRLLARPSAVADDLGAGRRLLALHFLAGGGVAVGYAAGQQPSGPRLIGGRAGSGSATPAGAPVAPAQQDRPRGIGRFAKDRSQAPRRLR